MPWGIRWVSLRKFDTEFPQLSDFFHGFIKMKKNRKGTFLGNQEKFPEISLKLSIFNRFWRNILKSYSNKLFLAQTQ